MFIDVVSGLDVCLYIFCSVVLRVVCCFGVLSRLNCLGLVMGVECGVLMRLCCNL